MVRSIPFTQGSFFMRYMFIAACLLTGCAISSPEPPLPEGKYRPINIPATPDKLDVFNKDAESNGQEG
jgi:hypothetical protein